MLINFQLSMEESIRNHQQHTRSFTANRTVWIRQMDETRFQYGTATGSHENLRVFSGFHRSPLFGKKSIIQTIFYYYAAYIL